MLTCITGKLLTNIFEVDAHTCAKLPGNKHMRHSPVCKTLFLLIYLVKFVLFLCVYQKIKKKHVLQFIIEKSLWPPCPAMLVVDLFSLHITRALHHCSKVSTWFSQRKVVVVVGKRIYMIVCIQIRWRAYLCYKNGFSR